MMHLALAFGAMVVASGLRMLAAAIRGLDPRTLALPEELGARSGGENGEAGSEVPPLVEVLERFVRAAQDLETGALVALVAAALALVPVASGSPGMTVSVALGLLAASPLVLVVLPERLAAGREAAVLGRAAPAILLLASVLRPLTRIKDFLAWPFSVFAPRTPPPPSGMAWNDDARAGGPLPAGGVPAESPSWLKRVLGFTRATVDEAMTPRAELVAVESGASISDLVAIVRTTRRGRYPIYRTSLDELVGQVALADLLEEADPTTPVDRHRREMTVVPESKPVFDLLKEMHASGTTMVMVIDEFGAVAGLANLHDLVAELLGEIGEDERPSSFEARRLDLNTWVLSPVIRIERFNELVGISIPEGDYQTVSGFILWELGRVPLPRERLRVNGGEFEVLAADSRRILSVRFKRRPAAGTG